MSQPREVDVIIAGGGAAGCVVAGRLAAADPNLEILVIEHGRNNYNDPQVIHPAMYLSHLKPDSTTAKFYAGKNSEHLGGRSPIVPIGNILGGGSSINFMVYARASGSDYDDWASEGWSKKDLIPLLRKIETYGLENKDSEIHGFNGPLKVSYGHQHVEVMEDFLEVTRDRGFPTVDDLQDLKTVDAYERWGKWINPETGRRSDAAHGYVHPMIGKSKLEVLCDSKVSRVIIENSKAVGVEYIPSIPPNTTDIPSTIPVPTVVRARKLVVISSGALGSPQILERSGIGNSEILKKAGVKPTVDLPGVGTNYQDHNLILCPFRVDSNTETEDDFLRGIPEVVAKAQEDFKQGKGYLSANSVDVGGKIRPNEKELAEMGPEFRKFWDEYLRDAPDKPVLFVGLISSFLGDHSLVPPGKYITLGSYLEYPASRGYIHINSTNPYTHPDFDPGFLSDPADLAPNMWGYKIGREIVRRMKTYRGELPALHPKFPPNSAVACHDVDVDTAREISSQEVASGVALTAQAGPSPIHLENKKGKVVEDLVYSEEDNKALEQWVRENIATTWHSIGTLAMKPREQGGVVDAKLNVYGVQNLKVADLSICPGNVAANTYNTALVVGEKAAVLCGEHLGISNV